VFYYSAKKKNEIMPFAGKWTEVNLMLSEISQPQKTKDWMGRVAQVVELLPSKLEALSLNLSTVKEKSQFTCFCTFVEPRPKIMMTIIIVYKCEKETI
jgi:hypothetical protein